MQYFDTYEFGDGYLELGIISNSKDISQDGFGEVKEVFANKT